MNLGEWCKLNCFIEESLLFIWSTGQISMTVEFFPFRLDNCCNKIASLASNSLLQANAHHMITTHKNRNKANKHTAWIYLFISIYIIWLNSLSSDFFLMYGLLYKFPQCFCSAKLTTISGHHMARDHQLWRIGWSNERHQGGQVRIHMLTLFGQCDTCQQPAKQPKVRWKVLPLFFFSRLGEDKKRLVG